MAVVLDTAAQSTGTGRTMSVSTMPLSKGSSSTTAKPYRQGSQAEHSGQKDKQAGETLDRLVTAVRSWAELLIIRRAPGSGWLPARSAVGRRPGSDALANAVLIDHEFGSDRRDPSFYGDHGGDWPRHTNEGKVGQGFRVPVWVIGCQSQNATAPSGVRDVAAVRVTDRVGVAVRVTNSPLGVRDETAQGPSWCPAPRPWSMSTTTISIRDLGFEAQDGRETPPAFGFRPPRPIEPVFVHRDAPRGSGKVTLDLKKISVKVVEGCRALLLNLRKTPLKVTPITNNPAQGCGIGSCYAH